MKSQRAEYLPKYSSRDCGACCGSRFSNTFI